MLKKQHFSVVLHVAIPQVGERQAALAAFIPCNETISKAQADLIVTLVTHDLLSKYHFYITY